jgi:hypothetical protein
MQQMDLGSAQINFVALCKIMDFKFCTTKKLATYKLIKKNYLFHIKYNVLNYFTHYLPLSLCSVISSLNKLNCDRKNN